MNVRVTKRNGLWIADVRQTGFGSGEELALDIPIGDSDMNEEDEE